MQPVEAVCLVPLIQELRTSRAPARCNVRAADIHWRPLARAGRMRWYQRGEKNLTDSAG